LEDVDVVCFVRRATNKLLVTCDSLQGVIQRENWRPFQEYRLVIR
jgi:hypothetical protein